LKDIGFFPNNLRIEATSRFAYLTQKANLMFINIILVDPYYEVCQIAQFTSFKRFDLDSKKVQSDVIMKAGMYCTKENKSQTDYDIKVLLQYPTKLMTYELAMPEDGEESYYSETMSEDSGGDEDGDGIKETSLLS